MIFNLVKHIQSPKTTQEGTRWGYKVVPPLWENICKVPRKLRNRSVTAADDLTAGYIHKKRDYCAAESSVILCWLKFYL